MFLSPANILHSSSKNDTSLLWCSGALTLLETCPEHGCWLAKETLQGSSPYRPRPKQNHLQICARFSCSSFSSRVFLSPSAAFTLLLHAGLGLPLSWCNPCLSWRIFNASSLKSCGFMPFLALCHILQLLLWLLCNINHGSSRLFERNTQTHKQTLQETTLSFS